MSAYAIVDLDSAGPSAVMMTFDDKDAAEAALAWFYIRRIRATIRTMPLRGSRTTGRSPAPSASAAAAPSPPVRRRVRRAA
jgi:hypothetical protein